MPDTMMSKNTSIGNMDPSHGAKYNFWEQMV